MEPIGTLEEELRRGLDRNLATVLTKAVDEGVITGDQRSEIIVIWDRDPFGRPTTVTQ